MMTRYILSRHLTMGCMSLLAFSISQAVSAGQLVTPQSSLPLSTEEDSSALTFNPDFLKFSDG
ncbi:TPA: hypothetical protein ACIT51_005505, partial [Salmonella enterica subsp. enterica serovar Java]